MSSSLAKWQEKNTCSLIYSYFLLIHQMFFATCMLHVHLMHWDDENSVERAVARCDEVWEFLDPHKVCVRIH